MSFLRRLYDNASVGFLVREVVILWYKLKGRPLVCRVAGEKDGKIILLAFAYMQGRQELVCVVWCEDEMKKEMNLDDDEDE